MLMLTKSAENFTIFFISHSSLKNSRSGNRIAQDEEHLSAPCIQIGHTNNTPVAVITRLELFREIIHPVVAVPEDSNNRMLVALSSSVLYPCALKPFDF
jgi:hypothetical protein